MENVSLNEMESLVQKLAQVKKKLEEISEQEKKAQEVRRELEGQILSHLKTNGTTGYLSSVGRVDIRTSLSYKTPKDFEQKEKLFEYIKSKGHDVYISLLSINSQTLNAWAKAETQSAIDQGIFPFSIPGIDEPISYETITFRKS